MTTGDDQAGGPAPPLGGGRSAQLNDGELMVELNALLGRGTHYAGKLYFEGRVRIEGHFEGEIRGEDVLVIGEGAEVDGDIEVGVCIVTGGLVRAHIRARDAIELHAPAVVQGNLHAPNVFIDRGVQFEGSCKMAPLDDDRLDDEETFEATAAASPGDVPADGDEPATLPPPARAPQQTIPGPPNLGPFHEQPPPTDASGDLPDKNQA